MGGAVGVPLSDAAEQPLVVLCSRWPLRCVEHAFARLCALEHGPDDLDAVIACVDKMPKMPGELDVISRKEFVGFCHAALGLPQSCFADLEQLFAHTCYRPGGTCGCSLGLRT